MLFKLVKISKLKLEILFKNNPHKNWQKYLIMNSSFSQKGFSLIEVLLVLMILSIFIALAIPSFRSARKFNADDQAMLMVDIFDEARQSAMNQRKTFRVEINKTKNQVTLINEKGSASTTDDEVVKQIQNKSFVKVGEIPNNILNAPTTTSPIPVLSPVTSNYPLSSGDEKITLRFAKNGLVMDTGTNNTGNGSIPRGATIYVFSNKEGTATPEIIRAVTVLQTSGDSSILKCTFNNGRCGNWRK